MKECELRIGNLIKVKGDAGIYKVISIDARKVVIFGGARDYEEKPFSKISGIKLTEEHILNGGFVLADPNIWRKHWGRNGTNFIRRYPDGLYYYEVGSFFSVHIPFVHRLQNIHAELTLFNDLLI